MRPPGTTADIHRGDRSSVIGVLFGQSLTQFVPAELLRKGAAVAFVIVGILVWFDVL